MFVETYIGEIRMFAGAYAPQGWALCQGQLMAITSAQALFSVIGTTYGGDGISSFALPDLRGRIPVGYGSTHLLGERTGTETVTVHADSMPVHTHNLCADTSTATQTDPNDVMFGEPVASGDVDYLYVNSSTSLVQRNMASGFLQSTGEGLPHNNIMPCQVINYIIATDGTYPVRA